MDGGGESLCFSGNPPLYNYTAKFGFTIDKGGGLNGGQGDAP